MILVRRLPRSITNSSLAYQLDHIKLASTSGPPKDDSSDDSSHTIDFGYKAVPVDEKQKLVGQVFSSVASSYDIMNDLMSGGMHRLWKDSFVGKLAIFDGIRHLDVAGGTGDIAFRIIDAIRKEQQQQNKSSKSAQQSSAIVTVCDINADMLEEGKKKAAAKNLDTNLMEWVEGNAEHLPFPDNTFDSYTIAFGIRNVTDKDAALRDAFRVLKPGGRFLCLEFSKVVVPGLQQLYDLYSFAVIPELGRIVANDRESYSYLVESIRMFPDQESFAKMIRQAGFQGVSYENFTGGIVAIHSGLKPPL